MKRFVIKLMLLCFIITNFATNAYGEELQLSANSSVLMDAASGQVLLSKNADEKINPSSTTMVLTALVALDNVKLDEVITVTAEAIELGVGSDFKLQEGERLTVEQLIASMFLQSSGDAAMALAFHVGGTLGEFSKMMNEKAKEIGMTNSNFINPSGIHDEEHKSTARDMAKLMAYAMKVKSVEKLLSYKEFTIPPTNKTTAPRSINNISKLFDNQGTVDVGGKTVAIAYEGLVASKAGYSDMAKNCMLSAATRGDLTLIVTVFGAEGANVYSDTHALFNFGFANFKIATIIKANEFVDNFTITNSKEEIVPAVVKEGFTMPILDGQTFDVERVVRELKVDLPLKKGDPIAEMDIRVNGEIVSTLPIVTTIDVNNKTAFRVWPILQKIFIPLFAIILFLFIIMLIIRQRNRRKKKLRLQQKRRQERIKRRY
ncbi:MAG: D-alanyl-D-alanine carboxypeptidase [Tissierellia bacterium]|nr:D-alanyl-D-alanine carboxypeptidase [Tissierellia bacterium]